MLDAMLILAGGKCEFLGPIGHSTWPTTFLLFINDITTNLSSAITMKITGTRTTAGKTHVGPVNHLYIIMFKIRKITPNSGSVWQKPKKFSRWLVVGLELGSSQMIASYIKRSTPSKINSSSRTSTLSNYGIPRGEWSPSHLMGALTFLFFLILFFLKLIMVCRLCVIYVREDNDSNV